MVRAQNLCVFASTDAVVFDSKNGIFFFAVQSSDGSGPRDVIYTFDQIDLPELVPLSQLDKREDQLTGEIDELNG